MKLNEFYKPQIDNKQEEKYNNIKSLLIFIFIVILAYLIEKLFRNSMLKNFYLLIILAIIAVFILFNISPSYPLIVQIKYFLNKNFNNSKTDSKDKITKEKLQKVKNIYESGYIFNKMNNNLQGSNQIFNRKQENNVNNRPRNDDDLVYKILNINKINNEPLMNSFSKKIPNENNNEKRNENFIYNNKYIFNNNNDDYEIKGLKNYTNIPTNEYEFNQNKLLNNNSPKDIISSPFNKKTRLPSSSDSSSGNFNLLSNNGKNKISNIKIISNFNSINPINSLSFNQSIPDFGNSICENQIQIIPKNKEISFGKYQYLKSRYSNTQALNQENNKLKYNYDKIPRDLAIIDYKSWIVRLKNFISRNLIPNIITKHDENISNLNSILSYLGIKIISTLPDNNSEDFLRILNEKIYFLNSNKIDLHKDTNPNQPNNILYKNAKNFFDNNYKLMNKDMNENNNNKFSDFPSLMNFNDYLNEKKELENNKYNAEKKLNKIFFGDTIKMKQILGIIEKKINILEIQKNNEIQNITHSQRQKIIKAINLNNNPFLKNEDTKRIDTFISNMNITNKYTLTNLQRLLYERIIINERLFPKELLYKKNETHVLLVIEYAIERLKQLDKNFNLYGDGSNGGEFLNDSWCSILPTDSQLIAHLMINHLETLYEINYNKNQQVFLLSYPSNYNILKESNNLNIKSQTSVFLYQINPPDVGPKFNIVYDGNLIPCPLDDINLFHAFSIYFYLLSAKSPTFVMNFGIHSFINELIK